MDFHFKKSSHWNENIIGSCIISPPADYYDNVCKLSCVAADGNCAERGDDALFCPQDGLLDTVE